MVSKLIMMRGLPASGKSTKAEEIVKADGDYYRVNRDLLRTMLHCDQWSRDREAVTVDAAQMLVANLLQQGKNVIVDDTNLGDKHVDMWTIMAQQFGADFQIIDMMNEVSVADCLERNADRIDKARVPDHVIQNMALEYGYISDDRIIICDIDGTIADCQHRLHHILEKPKDYKAFYAEMDKDTPIEEVYKNVVNDAIANDAQIVMVTARPEDYREVTEQWLRGNNMNEYTHLLMRRKGDKRKDSEVKAELYRRYLQRYDVIKAYEDREHVADMWAEYGIEVERV